jgi:predicted ester cyclase
MAEGDKVVARYTTVGTHEGDFMGVSRTGKQVTMTGVVIARFVNGKVVETWDFFDTTGLMEQLGVVPAVARAGS